MEQVLVLTDEPHEGDLPAALCQVWARPRPTILPVPPDEDSQSKPHKSEIERLREEIAKGADFLLNDPEPRWPATVALALCALFYLVLPDALFLGPRWLVPALVVLPAISLNAFHHHIGQDEPSWVRHTTLVLIGFLNIANIGSVYLLVHRLLNGHVVNGRPLVYSAALIWLTNAVAFSLWFWQIDRGGPAARHREPLQQPDFSFPQMQDPQVWEGSRNWMPSYLDYLYVSFTNASAFSPTDAMPLTVRVKALMAVESLVSIVTIVVVAARAINILH